MRIFKWTLLGLMMISFVSVAQKKSSYVTDTTRKKEITIKGIVEKGVEAGCVILRTKENKVYLLLNLKTSVAFGSCIKATGYIQKDVATICMQGVPFYVKNYCPCGKKSKPKYQRELPKDKIKKE